VRTPLLSGTGGVGELVLGASAIEADEVADVLLAAMAAGRFLVLPHPEVAGFAVSRASDPDAWLAGMRKIQSRVDELPPARR
jgi:hypothetical protein